MLTNRRTTRLGWLAASAALGAWTMGCSANAAGEPGDAGLDAADVIVSHDTGPAKDAARDAAKDVAKDVTGHDTSPSGDTGTVDATADQTAGDAGVDAPATGDAGGHDGSADVVEHDASEHDASPDSAEHDAGEHDAGKDAAGPTTSLGVSPTVLDFTSAGNAPGFVSCGASPATQTFTVTNTGTTSIEWWSAFGLGAASPYAVSTTCTQAAPCTLAAGAAATVVTVTGAPVSATAGIVSLDDTVTVFSSAPGDTGHVIQLNEQSYGAILAVSPTDENFGSQPNKGTYPETIQVLNSGNAPVNATLALTAGSSTEFTISGPTLMVPPAGASFTTTFTPAGDTNAVTGQVAITAPPNSTCAPLPSNLTLEGQGTVALLSVTPSLNFNSGANGNNGIGVSCGTTGPTLNAVVTNTGTGAATITGVTLGLGANSPYTVKVTTGTVNPGVPFDIPVVPNPIPASAAPGVSYDDTLTVTTSAGTYTVALNETSAGAVLSLASTALAFSPARVGEQSIYQTSVTNTGNVTANFAFSSNNPVFTFDPNLVVTANASVLPNAYFEPTAAQKYSGAGALTVAAGTPTCSSFSGTIPMTFTGTGTNGNTYNVAPKNLAFGDNTCGAPAPAAQTVTITDGAVAGTTWTAALSGNDPTFFMLSAAMGTVNGNGGTATLTVTPIALTSASGLTAAQVQGRLTATLTVTVGTGATAETFTIPVSESPYGAFPLWNVNQVTVNRGKSANFNLRNVSSVVTSFNLASGNASFVVSPTSGSASVGAPLTASVKDNAATAANTTITATLTTPTAPLCGPLPAPLPVTGN